MTAPGPRDRDTARAPVTTDGLPTLDSGEPVLARWFVIAMLALIPVAVAVSLWALLSFDRPEIPPAARRPPGTATVTHERGEAILTETRDTRSGPGCALGIDVVGDPGTRAAGERALAAACQLISGGDFPAAAEGLRRWAASDGRLRFATFELAGVDSSARVASPDAARRGGVADGAVVIELNSRFVFENATQAAPFVPHELVHLAEADWPGQPLSDSAELRAMRIQASACGRLAFPAEPPRGCRDARALLDAPQPLEQLQEAGYGAGR